MQPLQTLTNLPHLQIRSPSKSPTPISRHKPFLFLLLLILPFSLLLIPLLAPSPKPSFAIIIDAGSTGTRIHVFSSRIRSGSDPLPLVDPIAELKVRPGLSSYVGTAAGAGESVRELVEFAKGKVPREMWAETEVRLMATAGLRMGLGRRYWRVVGRC